MKVKKENLLLYLAFALPLLATLCLALTHDWSWSQMPDTILYLGVGQEFWSGRGLLDIDGTFFHAHGPLGPIFYQAVYLLSGGTLAPRMASYFILASALCLAVFVSWRISNSRGALATSTVLLAVPFFWKNSGNLILDPIQMLLSLVVLLLLLNNKNINFILAGLAFAASLLFKETNALLALAPLAWIGAEPLRQALKRWGLFLLATAVGAGWWWVVVWVNERIIFPFDRLDSAFGTADLTTWVPIAGIFLIVWALLIYRDWANPRIRLLVISVLSTLPSIIIVFMGTMSSRQLVLFACFSAIAAGALIYKYKEWIYWLLISLVAIAALVNLISQRQFETTTKDLAPVSEYLKERYPNGAEITSNWGRSRRLFYETDKIYITKYLPFSYCPCDGPDLVRAGMTEAIAQSPNRDILVIGAPDLADHLSRLPGIDEVWRTRAKGAMANILVVDKALLPESSAIRKHLLLHRPELPPGYTPKYTVVPFPW